jgi:Flp pilus assembly protein TadG
MTRRRPTLGARRESGTITLWMLGLCLMLFLLGGISLDLWRAFSERRSLAATADAAAVAGASALDEAAYRRMPNAGRTHRWRISWTAGRFVTPESRRPRTR